MTSVAAIRLLRRWNRRVLTLCLAAGSGLAVLHAHRLDECLQTTFVTVWPDHLELDLVLTPGVAVAPEILAGIDRNSDGVISPAEAEDYASKVLGAITLTLDGATPSLRVAAREFPDLELVRAGQGAIRIQLLASHPPLSTGMHALHYRNDHLTNVSVYLVNATLPPSPDIRITGQHRDSEQRSTRIEFSRTHGAPRASSADGQRR